MYPSTKSPNESRPNLFIDSDLRSRVQEKILCIISNLLESFDGSQKLLKYLIWPPTQSISKVKIFKRQVS